MLCAYAALSLAVNRVNADQSLLPGYTLKFMWRDSGCSASKAVKAFVGLEEEKMDVLIGPACRCMLS